MKIRVAERHMEVGAALRDYAVSKVEALERYFDGIISVDIVMDVQRERQIVDMVAHLIKKKTAKTTVESNSMYASIDEAVDKLKRQLRRYKTRLKEKKRTYRAELMSMSTDENVTEQERAITRTQLPIKKPMTLDEAILQLETDKRNFLLFVDAERGQLNVLHRKGDGSYELIEPEY